MANGSDDNRRKRSKPSKPGSVEDWLAQRLAMVDGAEDDDRSDPGVRPPAAEDDEEAPTVRARVAEPPPRPSRLRPASEAPVARTIPPSRPGWGPPTTSPESPPPAPPPSDLDLPDFEAEPLATEDVEPLLTEEVEPIEAPSDTDEVPKGAAGRGSTPAWQAPDEAMWDLLGETTGSTATVSGSTASVAVGAPAAAESAPGAPTPRSASRASQAATIPPASIKVGATKSPPRPTLEPPGPELPLWGAGSGPRAASDEAAAERDLVSFDAEPPIRRTADEHPDVTVSSAADPVDALIAEASASPRPRRRRTAFSRTAEATPSGESTPAEMGLVAGDTLTPEETEPPSPPSGFDEVFPISRGIPPVRARGARAVPPPAVEEPTSALLATDAGAPAAPAPAEAEPGTEWLPPDAAPAAEEEEDDRTQIRPQQAPALAETLPRPQERGRPAEEAPGVAPGDPTRQPFRPLVVQPVRPARDADDESVDDDATQQRAVVPGAAALGEAGGATRRFHAPPDDDESDLAGTLPPEVSSAVITWGSVIVGVLMFFVTMVLFALFIVPYLA